MHTARYYPFGNIYFNLSISTLINLVFSLFDARGLDPALDGDEPKADTLAVPTHSQAQSSPTGFIDKDNHWEPPEYLTITRPNRHLQDQTDDELECVDDPHLHLEISEPERTDDQQVQPPEPLDALVTTTVPYGGYGALSGTSMLRGCE